MRILLTNTGRAWSGEAAYVEMLARGLADRDHATHVASRRGSELGHRIRRAGLPLTELALDRSPTHLGQDLLAVRRLAAGFEPDVLHCNASRDSWLGSIAFRTLRHRTVLVRTKHNVKRIRRSLLNRFLYRHAFHALIAPSAQVLEHLHGCPTTSGVRTRLIRYGIDVARFPGDAQSRRVARPEMLKLFPGVEDPLVAIYLSRLSPRKHPEAAVQAVLAQGRGSAPARPVVLAMAGNGNAEVESRTRALAQGDPRVVFLGFRTDVARLLAGADVFLLPSPDEAFGLAVVEAMACGAVPILPASGSFPGMLEDSEAGLLYDPVDQVRGIAEALARLGQDSADLAARRQAGRRHARRFDVNWMVEQTLGFYQELLQDRREMSGRAMPGHG